MSAYTAALSAATEAVMLDDPAEVSAAYDRLVALHGHDVTSKAWHEACNTADWYAEHPECRTCSQPTHLEDLTDPVDAGTDWAGICLLCFEAATRPAAR